MQQCGARSPVLSRVVLSGSLTGGDWAVARTLCSRGAGGSSFPPDQCRHPLAGASKRIETTSSNAGGPGRALREPRRGATGELNRALWGRATRALWQPSAGGLCLHSTVPCPGDPDRGSTRDFRRGERAYRGRRRDVAARQREPPGACLPEAVRRIAPSAMCTDAPGVDVQCSPRGSTDPTTRARRGRTTDLLPLELGFPMVLDPTDADSPT